jgi:hypothetical protein
VDALALWVGRIILYIGGVAFAACLAGLLCAYIFNRAADWKLLGDFTRWKAKQATKHDASVKPAADGGVA